MHQQEPKPESTAFILGAVADFMYFLNSHEAPIVTGLDYKPDRVVDAFTEWAASRGVSIKSIDRSTWIKACQQGLFKDENT